MVRNIVIQLAKKTFWAEHELAWISGKNTSKTGLRSWKKLWNAWRIPTRVGICFHSVGAKILQNMWEAPCWKGVWPCLDSWDVVRLRTSSSFCEKYGAHNTASFSSSSSGRSRQCRSSLCLCENAQGVCAGWFAPCGSRRSWIKW